MKNFDLDAVDFLNGKVALHSGTHDIAVYQAQMNHYADAQIYCIGLSDSMRYPYRGAGGTLTAGDPAAEAAGRSVGVGATLTPPNQTGASGPATDWMPIAQGEIGTREIPGVGINPRIGEYLKVCGTEPNDAIPWCSAFANWVMEHAGWHGTKDARARSWLNWGTETIPRYGCVAVFSRGNQGHVGFYVGQEGNHLKILGGNQGNMVKISYHSATTLLGFRWPTSVDRKG